MTHHDRGPAVVPPQSLLEVRNLTVEYSGPRRSARPVTAVDNVSLYVAKGETLGLVGESGSGKSTIGRAILGLTPPTRGSVSFSGTDITHASARERRLLSSEIQVVFQDPYSSLNPTRTIGQTLAEMLRRRSTNTRTEIAGRVGAMLSRVGLDPQASDRYPAHFSGGQRQRIAIARALMVEPRLVVCDEPVSALDLSAQAQILNLLCELQDDLGLAYLFIAHDLDVVRHLSHRLVVLYRGQVMEMGAADRVHDAPRHPYTRVLLDAAPVPDPEAQRRRRAARVGVAVQAEPAGGGGCVFAGRCPFTIDICNTTRPGLEATTDQREVACHRWADLPDRSVTDDLGAVHAG